MHLDFVFYIVFFVSTLKRGNEDEGNINLSGGCVDRWSAYVPFGKEIESACGYGISHRRFAHRSFLHRYV